MLMYHYFGIGGYGLCSFISYTVLSSNSIHFLSFPKLMFFETCFFFLINFPVLHLWLCILVCGIPSLVCFLSLHLGPSFGVLHLVLVPFVPLTNISPSELGRQHSTEGNVCLLDLSLPSYYFTP